MNKEKKSFDIFRLLKEKIKQNKASKKKKSTYTPSWMYRNE